MEALSTHIRMGELTVGGLLASLTTIVRVLGQLLPNFFFFFFLLYFQENFI